MSGLYQKVVDGWPVIAAAPETFAAILIAFIVVAVPSIWLVLSWSYRSRLESRDSQIALLQRQRDDYKDRAIGASANTSHQAIAIEFEPTKPFVRRTVFPAGNARFELYIRVKNVGNGFLSEVTVSVVEIVPKPAGHAYGALSEQFVLPKGEHRYVLVAGFNETRIEDQAIYNDLVAVSFADGGMFARYATFGPPSASAPVLFTLEAKALECRAETKRFKVWVAENRRLMMAEA